MGYYMVQEQELIKLIEHEGLNLFEVRQNPKINDDAIVMKEVNDLIKFCKINDIKNLFYNYIFLDKEEFIISDEAQEKIEKDIYKLIKKEIKEHNKRVETIDFTRPIILNISTIFENNLVCVLENDYWHEEINLLDAEDTIEYLQENYDEILEQKEAEKEEKLELLKNELKQYMLEDENFLICTNKDLRKNYAEMLMKNKKMKKYLEPFKYSHSDGIWVQSLVMFVEVVWAEYRNRRY